MVEYRLFITRDNIIGGWGQLSPSAFDVADFEFNHYDIRINGTVFIKQSQEFVESYNKAELWEKISSPEINSA